MYCMQVFTFNFQFYAELTLDHLLDSSMT
jgi:hypothetical protein